MHCLFKNKKIVALFYLLISFTSCQRIIEQAEFNREQENYTSPYQGTYSGTFTGDETGKFTLQVSKSGTVSGIRSEVDPFYGGLQDYGALFNVQSPTSGFTLNGSLQSKSGTWKVGNLTGNWTVTKQ